MATQLNNVSFNNFDLSILSSFALPAHVCLFGNIILHHQCLDMLHILYFWLNGLGIALACQRQHKLFYSFGSACFYWEIFVYRRENDTILYSRYTLHGIIFLFKIPLNSSRKLCQTTHAISLTKAQRKFLFNTNNLYCCPYRGNQWIDNTCHCLS